MVLGRSVESRDGPAQALRQVVSVGAIVDLFELEFHYGAMVYRYEFEDTRVGDLRLGRSKYEKLQEAYILLRDELSAWNDRARRHGAPSGPYEAEFSDLDHMINFGAEKLAEADASDIVVNGVSVGSLRYAKAALMLMIQKLEMDRNDKERQGWPNAALQSLDRGVEPFRDVVKIIQYEPSGILWEVIPRIKESSPQEASSMPEWDVFISHASEDKEEFVRPLAEGLRARGLKVWFDEFSLTVGDSLRRSIDRGLADSRFGVVVISQHFMLKEWPQKELDGLVAREVDGVKVILPVWHNISAAEIRKFSPMLADRVAVSSDKGLDHVIAELVRAIERDAESNTVRTLNVAAPARSTESFDIQPIQSSGKNIFHRYHKGEIGGLDKFFVKISFNFWTKHQIEVINIDLSYDVPSAFPGSIKIAIDSDDYEAIDGSYRMSKRVALLANSVTNIFVSREFSCPYAMADHADLRNVTIRIEFVGEGWTGIQELKTIGKIENGGVLNIHELSVQSLGKRDEGEEAGSP